MTNPNDDRRVVYSTDGGRQVLEKTPRVKAPGSKLRVPDDGVVRVFRERRRASAVTVVTGLAEPELQAIGADLRRRCATGGTAKNGIVELQGDHRAAVIAYFEAAGRRVKSAGG
jgi:translation initiation factor 1